jgi:hypothetical protein
MVLIAVCGYVGIAAFMLFRHMNLYFLEHREHCLKRIGYAWSYSTQAIGYLDPI